jgi:Protein of unknown function (DUF1761)
MICDVNIWAVLVAGLVVSGIGMFWYSPLFLGKHWMVEVGLISSIDSEVKPSDEDKKKMWWLMLANLVATVITIFILGRLMVLTTTSGVAEVAALAVMIWIGFTAMFSVGAVIWEKKTWKYFWINAGYQVVALIVSAVILALWK